MQLIEERVESLVRLFHGGKVIEKIVNSEDSVIEYMSQKEIYQKELQEFKEFMFEPQVCACEEQKEAKCKRCGNRKIIEVGYEIFPEDVIQICMICIMSGVDDIFLFQRDKDLVEGLEKVEEYKAVAQKILEFLSKKKLSFSMKREEELIQCFFS